MHDGFPLRLWKVSVEVPASPEDVLTRVLREQGHWDEDLLECRTVETLNDRTDIYQYVRNSMAPHPSRDHVVLRYTRRLPPALHLFCVLVLTQTRLSEPGRGSGTCRRERVRWCVCLWTTMLWPLLASGPTSSCPATTLSLAGGTSPDSHTFPGSTAGK